MFIFAVGAGVAAFWFWFLAPDFVSDRVRHAGGALALIVCVGSMWLTVHTSNQMLQIARTAQAEGERREAEKRRLIRQIRSENEEGYGGGYARPDTYDRLERQGFRGAITN